jgi:hypothetical protein
MVKTTDAASAYEALRRSVAMPRSGDEPPRRATRQTKWRHDRTGERFPVAGVVSAAPVKPELRRVGATVGRLDRGRLDDVIMLYVRFLAGAGGVLLILMWVANALLPPPEASTAEQTTPDHPTIRITSTLKGPERAVIDTSLPTIVPPASPAAVAAATPPAAALSFTARDAFAQMPAEASGAPTAARSAVAEAKPPHKPAHRHVARRGLEPQYGTQYGPPPQPRQVAGGFFPFFGFR